MNLISSITYMASLLLICIGGCSLASKESTIAPGDLISGDHRQTFPEQPDHLTRESSKDDCKADSGVRAEPLRDDDVIENEG